MDVYTVQIVHIPIKDFGNKKYNYLDKFSSTKRLPWVVTQCKPACSEESMGRRFEALLF